MLVYSKISKLYNLIDTIITNIEDANIGCLLLLLIISILKMDLIIETTIH